MSETTILRTSAIVRHATVGAPPPHGPVKTGALPLVQVRQVPSAPAIQADRQRAVEIQPPRDAQSAVAIGGLPVVQVRMTSQGPQRDDGRGDQRVVIKDAHNPNVNAGGLPMVEVKMENGRPQVQNLSNVQAARPPIQSPAPALSRPRVARVAAPQQTQTKVSQLAPVQAAPAPAVESGPELSIDQLMLLRFLADKCLGEMRADVATEAVQLAENAKLAEDTIFVLDQQIAAVSAAAEAAAAAPVAVVAQARPATVGYVNPAAYPVPQRPATSAYAPAGGGYVAQRPGMRGHVTGVRSHGSNASMAPRRVVRPAGSAPLPPVVVKMDGGKAVVQNTAEVDAARTTGGGVLPPVVVKMDGGKAVVQNQAEIDAAREMVQAQEAQEAIETTATSDAPEA